MPIRIIPDTCVWIDFFKGNKTPLVSRLERELVDGNVHTCGVILYELLQGIRNKREEAQVRAAFQAITTVDMADEIWIAAASISSDLRKKGVTIPLSDILIAAVALNNNLTVISADEHFKTIPDLKLIMD
jgi:predicted nucleic acid-binding protein